MAFCSRRTLQRLLDENSAFLTSTQARQHVAKLNNASKSLDSIATEWEVATLNAFGRLGKVVHEPELATRTHPDICFTPYGDHSQILMDITTVSDKHLHRNNPQDALSRALSLRIRPLRDQGLRGSFTLGIQARPRSPFVSRDPVELWIPEEHNFKRFIFNSGFDRFLRAIQAAPHLPRTYSVLNERANVSVTFNPQGRWGVSCSFPSYTITPSKTRNLVANALHDKAKQLAATGLEGVFGIVLCDGACDLFRRKASRWNTFGLHEVIREFLRTHTSIAFVLTLSVRQKGNAQLVSDVEIEAECHFNRDRKGISSAAVEALRRIPEFLPIPRCTVQNARHLHDWLRATDRWNEGTSYYGGCSMSGYDIKISARALQTLLAGGLDSATFLQAHGLNKTNPFAINLKEGRLISRVVVEKSTDDDDDWLVFQFGEPDAAVGEFR